MTQSLIGINGFKRTGKGETGAAIERNWLAPVKQVGFADALKVLGTQALGFYRTAEDLIALADSIKVETEITLEYLDPEVTPQRESDWMLHSTTGRSFFQQLGTRGREIFGDDVWVDIVLPRPDVLPLNCDGPDRHLPAKKALEERYPGFSLIAITDVRFPNEAERILALGGEVWEVIRPGTSSDGHASEQPLPRNLITRQIDNDGDLAKLEDTVTIALANMAAGWHK